MHFKRGVEYSLYQKLIENGKAKNAIDTGLYRKKRYGPDATIALVKSKDPLFAEKFHKKSRKTDYLIMLENEIYLIVYDNTSISGALKALENLFLKIDLHKEGVKAALTETKNEDSVNSIIKRAIDIFALSLSKKEDIVILDDSNLFI